MSKFLTTAKVAEMFGITETTVREWLRSGELIGVKVGSTWRVKESDLDRYLEDQRVRVLLERAKRKDPDVNWQETHCLQCGEVLIVKRPGDWVCNKECKEKYDRKLWQIAGDDGMPSEVAPHI
ncbi:MAG: helix-turn-helix domain-containing protein [Bacillota bacterium]